MMKDTSRVMVRTDGDLIYVICNKEDQQKKVISKMCTETCVLEHYEEWDEGEDKKWIMTWKVPQEYDKEIQYN